MLINRGLSTPVVPVLVLTGWLLQIRLAKRNRRERERGKTLAPIWKAVALSAAAANRVLKKKKSYNKMKWREGEPVVVGCLKTCCCCPKQPFSAVLFTAFSNGEDRCQYRGEWCSAFFTVLPIDHCSRGGSSSTRSIDRQETKCKREAPAMNE